jgi:asparagine synthase (glutamine-hydrolysing)
MCGICGIFNLDGKNASDKEVRVMCACMKHRGPDGEGIYADRNVSLGHRRLSIIDLSPAGSQPMAGEDSDYVIVFNGEIYNYEQILKSLKEKGYEFRGHSDTEAVLNLYIEKGKKCLDDLRGMFAFAIYDKKKKELFLARDRFGEKPIIYGTFKGRFYFASEIRAILEASGCERKIDVKALHTYLLYNFHHVPEPFTIIEGLRKLKPGHCMTVSKKGVSIKKYWNLDYSRKSGKSESDLVDEFRGLIKECVNLREVSDVPVSALLSGGVDSSTIVSLMNKRKSLTTFSLGLNKADPELLRARRLSKYFQTRHVEIMFDRKFLKKLPEVIYYYGEPYNLMPSIYSSVLAERISRDFKVTLSGNGADELLYGYTGGNWLLALSYLEKFFPRGLAKALLAMTPERFSSAQLFLGILSSDLKKQKGDLYRRDGERLKKDLYTDAALESLEGFDEGQVVDDVVGECNSPWLIERFYHAGLFLENAHSITIIADTTGMANSLEIRAPFLDHRLAEFTARLPLRMKVRSLFNNRKNKYILQKSMEGTLPGDLLYQKKMGFGFSIRVSSLIRNEWKDSVSRVMRKELPKTGIFDAGYLASLLDEHLSGKKDNGKLIWGLFSFYIWYEIYVMKRDYRKIL